MAFGITTGIPSNLLVTAAFIKLNGVDLGFASKVKPNIKEETTEVMTDQTGKSKINHFYVGNDITVEMTLDEMTALKLKTAFPQAALVGSPGNYKISWGKQIGFDYYSIAQSLEVHPTVDDAAYYGRTFTWWKAVPLGESAIEMTPDKKVEIKVVFRVYPDLTKAPGLWFGYMGDVAAGTLVPAAAGSPVAGGGNVGNGTVGSIIVNDTFTKTETWTLTCIHAAANSGIFSVVGSVTGARGNATVGSAYSSNVITPSNSEIGFTIADGATDFAVGDTFTIATTAKNYT